MKFKLATIAILIFASLATAQTQQEKDAAR